MSGETAAGPKGAMVTHTGGCHCGRIRFEVIAPASVEVSDCNCSMCRMLGGYLHLIVPRTRFRLLHGSEFLTTYTFHTGAARHTFCSVCGIKSFYVPRSHPDGISVSARCLDPGTLEVRIRPFDGAHWEEHVDELEPLSAPDAPEADEPPGGTGCGEASKPGAPR